MALSHLELCREKLKLLTSDGKVWTVKDEMQPIARLILLSCAIVSLRLTLRALFQCKCRKPLFNLSTLLAITMYIPSVAIILLRAPAVRR